MAHQQPEPWLRGTIEGLHAAAAHMLYTFEQAREELALHCTNLPDVWQSPAVGVAPVGFHLRHIAGSVDRLTTYLRGEQLNADQLAALKQEQVPGANFGELMSELDAEFKRTEVLVRSIDPSTYDESRLVGRRQLPTTVGGLIVHISEHTQRHLEQAVLTAKLVSPALPAD